MLLNCAVESPLDHKEIKPVYPKGNQSWIFIRRTDAEAETPILWPPDAKNWLMWKDPDAGKDWRQEEKGLTEDEMVGWHHQLDGHEFEQAPGAGDGQGSLVFCSPWGHKESDMTEQLNGTESPKVRQPGHPSRHGLMVTLLQQLEWEFWITNQHLSWPSGSLGNCLDRKKRCCHCHWGGFCLINLYGPL